MPRYEITSPDGERYEVTAPDGASQEQVLAYAQQQFAEQPRPDFSNVQGGSDTEPANSNPIGRVLGEYGGRQVLQGIGGTLDMLGGHAVSQFIEKPLGLSQGESYREKFANVADQMGMRRPETPQQRVVSDVGEALSGTGLTMGIGAGVNALANLGRTAGAPVVNRLGQFLTAQAPLQAVSSATGAGAAGVARESGASGGNQLLAGIAGALAPGALASGAAAGLRGLVRGASGEKMQNAIRDFASVGATPSVGQATGSRTLQGAENLLAGGPTSAGVMGRFAERQAESIGQGLQDRAEGFYRNASAERAGRAMERGVETFGRNVTAQKRALYWQADKFIPDTTKVPLPNAWQTVVKLTTPNPGAQETTKALINPRMAQLRDTLEADLAAGGGQVSYDALKRVRTNIGEAISDFSLSPDTPTRELKQLYGALSRDMEAAAQAMGPEAVRAAKRANNYTRAAADRLEQIQRVVDKNGGPEKVYTAAMSGTRDGGTTLRAVMQSLPKEGQKAVTAAVIKRMGLANPGGQDAAGEAFSAQTFLTNWNKVSPEAKRTLFDRFGPDFSRNMDRVASVAENIRDGAKVFQNPSGTANRGAAIGYWVSTLGALATGQAQVAGGLALGGAAANATARLLTAPWAVKWLANTTSLPVGSVVGQAQALRALAERHEDPELAELATVLEEKARQDQGGASAGQQ